MCVPASNGIATVMAVRCCSSADSVQLRVDRHSTQSRSIRTKEGVNGGTGKLNRKVLQPVLRRRLPKNARRQFCGSKSIIQRYVLLTAGQSSRTT
jgi:hypothetical protein